ncbi:PorP/SprF family type IX secretion system membrane protein [Aquirufa sp. ROCK2-A2]
MNHINNSSTYTKKRSKAFLWTLLLGLLIGPLAEAQIEPMYNMYRFNPQVISPTHAGSTDSSEIIIMNRQQWTNIEGMPKTYFLNGNFKWHQQSGLGFNAMFDQAGPVKIALLSGDYAYHARLGENWNLSGGIRLGLANVSLDFSGIRLVHDSDDLFLGEQSTGLKLNVGWGVKIAKKNGFFASLSMPRIIKYNFGDQSGGYKDVAYVYTMIGNKISLNEKLTLYPSFLARIASSVPLSWDANLLLNIKGNLDVGLNYRYQDSWGLRLGVQATKRIYIGYVYEMPTSVISKVSNPTHELALRFFVPRK